MSRCQKIEKPHRKICRGDLRDVITLNFRSITEPEFNSFSFDESFTPLDDLTPQTFSMIRTVEGKEYFDGAGERVFSTHHIYIAYDPRVTAEVWVTLSDPSGDRRLDILRVNDLEERHEFQQLVCADRGLVSKAASKA